MLGFEVEKAGLGCFELVMSLISVITTITVNRWMADHRIQQLFLHYI